MGFLEKRPKLGFFFVFSSDTASATDFNRSWCGFFSSLWLAVFEAGDQDGTLQRLLLIVLFRLLSISSLLTVQRLSRCALRPSSGISCRTQEPSCNREPSRNFEPNPLFNPRDYPVLIPLTIAGVQVLS